MTRLTRSPGLRATPWFYRTRATRRPGWREVELRERVNARGVGRREGCGEEGLGDRPGALAAPVERRELQVGAGRELDVGRVGQCVVDLLDDVRRYAGVVLAR